MLTVRQIERYWNGRKLTLLLDELLAPRVEMAAAGELTNACASAAALALVRLDELNQSHAPICAKLIRAILATQQSDGGWGDVASTALCLRALFLNEGYGPVIERGLGYLAALQQPTGIWPRIPIRRMPEDATVSAFVLLQLSDREEFRSSLRFADAVAWFEQHQLDLDAPARILWNHARIRGVTRPLQASWS